MIVVVVSGVAVSHCYQRDGDLDRANCGPGFGGGPRPVCSFQMRACLMQGKVWIQLVVQVSDPRPRWILC